MTNQTLSPEYVWILPLISRVSLKLKLYAAMLGKMMTCVRAINNPKFAQIALGVVIRVTENPL